MKLWSGSWYLHGKASTSVARTCGAWTGANSLLRRRRQHYIGLNKRADSASTDQHQVTAAWQDNKDGPLVEADALGPDTKPASLILSDHIPISTRLGRPHVLCMASVETGSGTVSMVDRPEPLPEHSAGHEHGSAGATPDQTADVTGHVHDGPIDDGVDSRQYVREVINLSVSLDSVEANMEPEFNMDEYTTGLQAGTTTDAVATAAAGAAAAQAAYDAAVSAYSAPNVNAAVGMARANVAAGGANFRIQKLTPVKRGAARAPTSSLAAPAPVKPPPSRAPGEPSEERQEARKLVNNFHCLEYVGQRHNWMMIIAPETPVAGEDCLILFNRLQSELLRVRPRLQVQFAFNQWQLNNNGSNFTAELSPAPMPKDNSDFWWCRIKVPEKAFELNFVVTDCEGLYENNNGQDFMYPVSDGWSQEQWNEHMAAVLKQQEEERQAEQRRKDEEAARERLLAMEGKRKVDDEERRKSDEEIRKHDMMKAQKRTDELLRHYHDQQKKGMYKLRSGKDQDDLTEPLIWTSGKDAPKAGSKAKLYYNRKATNLAKMHIKDDQCIQLRWGINGWQSTQVIDFKRCPNPPEDTQLAAPAPPAPPPPPPPPPSLTPTAIAAMDVPWIADAGAASAAVAAAPPPPPPPPPPKPAKPLAEMEWWEAEIEVPLQASVINFVVNFFNNYDNNNSKDYAVKVGLPEGCDFEQWSAQLTEIFRLEEYETRVAAESEARQRELRREERARRAQERVLAVERKKVRHVLFTEPESIQAGEEVTIWYSPENTNLNGKMQIFLTCGFNRWTHASPVGPLPMLPPDVLPTFDDKGNELSPYLIRSGSPTHWKATFVVPHDAYKMDFVFSDVPGGDGTYDNRGGYDYHLPVFGSPNKEESLYVVHIAVEMAPIAKVGGLGDVVTALGRAIKEQGHNAEVIVPKYEFFNHSAALNSQMRFETEFDWGGTRIVVCTAFVEELRVWFIEPRNQFFNTQSVYGRYDDEVRFDFFCKAALEFLLRTNRQPDILHCHDWSTAHVAKAYWEDYNPYGLWKPKVVFTIHNLNYGQKKIAEAALYCQRFTTVSPTYAFETGGHPTIATHVGKFSGIRNGIDPQLWSPEDNPFLPCPIIPDKFEEGKSWARNELRKRMGLQGWGDKAIISVVSRLTPQKGVHLIKHAAYRAVERGCQFVLLGSAPDPKLQAEFQEMASTMAGADAAFAFKYDEPLSHLIYAGSDMIVVPSMFEPCGLTQMIAMRYGTVPIVRHTGGLKDTVFDVDTDKARAAWELEGSTDWQRDGIDCTNGFAFEGTDTMALDYAMNRCIDAYYNDRQWFRSLQTRIMLQDWSWNRPCLDYIELYYATMKNN